MEVFNFVSRHIKKFYYITFYTLPIVLWIYYYTSYGGIEYYHPERKDYTVFPPKSNVAFIVLSDSKFKSDDITKIQYFKWFFCFQDVEQYDLYNPNFFVFVPEPQENRVDHMTYFHVYPSELSVFQKLDGDMDFLNKFDYLFFLRKQISKVNKEFCEEILHDFVVVKTEDEVSNAFKTPYEALKEKRMGGDETENKKDLKYSDFIVGGKKKFFKEFVKFLVKFVRKDEFKGKHPWNNDMMRMAIDSFIELKEKGKDNLDLRKEIAEKTVFISPEDILC